MMLVWECSARCLGIWEERLTNPGKIVQVSVPYLMEYLVSGTMTFVLPLVVYLGR